MVQEGGARKGAIAAGKDIVAGSGSRRMRIWLVCCVGLLVGLIVGISYYVAYVRPMRAAVISVDDDVIRMSYFLKRVESGGGDPLGALQSLVNEELVKLGAPRYGISITPDEVSQELRSQASGDGKPVSDDEFKEWYRQQRNQTGLSDSEYRALVHLSLTQERLRQYLEDQVPKAGEQVHLNVMLLENQNNLNKAKSRLSSGETFAAVARDMSMDESAADGGDMGWLPRGLNDKKLEDIFFSLKAGEVSEAYETDQGYVLYLVSEKAASRAIDDASLRSLKSNALADWLAQEAGRHKITYSFNSETYAWINDKLGKSSAPAGTR
ncbi:MAG: peptidylprolyl isomerase [Chloroflexi bacterium]|nr:peptidylprolyl isomerase [Chloroflexota bacterium]